MRILIILKILFGLSYCEVLRFQRYQQEHPVTMKPNFIIMIMDDVGWGDLGCYGNPARETPNLDRMASEGMLFTDFYSASAICSPSRASIMTGRLPVRNGFYSTSQKARNSYTPQEVMGGIADEEVLFSELLAKAGYTNKIIGKWHLGHQEKYLPLKHGFHEWLGAPNCHYRYDNKYIPNIPFYKDNEMIGRYYDDIIIEDELGLSNLTQIYTQSALDFIKSNAIKKQPFMLYWTPDATHTPLYTSEHFRGKSKRGLYGDALMELDHGVGEILETLHELKIADNTLVIFSSDNGAATYAYEEGGSNGPLLCGKQTTFEGGMREPAIAWWPGTIKPMVTNDVATLMDIFPTVADFAGLELPKSLVLDGKSMKRILLNESETVQRPIFFYRGDTLFAIRYELYKAHYYTWGTPKFAADIGYEYCPGQHVKGLTTENMTDYLHHPLLFHLGRDPGEKHPIEMNSNEYRDTVGIIQQALKEHESSMEFAKPQLDWCDMAIQNWSPKGCEKIDRCLEAPMSEPYKCVWNY